MFHENEIKERIHWRIAVTAMLLELIIYLFYVDYSSFCIHYFTLFRHFDRSETNYSVFGTHTLNLAGSLCNLTPF